MEKGRDGLKKLHTALIDARNGYEEALKDSEGKGLAPLFQEMSELHGRHAAELGTILTTAGEKANDDGSFMTAVHKTVISLRSLFGKLDESILPGLIDGEKRLLSQYDETLAHSSLANDKILKQRYVVEAKIKAMELRKSMAA